MLLFYQIGDKLFQDLCQEIYAEHSNGHEWISADEEHKWNITDSTVSVVAGEPHFDTVPIRIVKASSIRGSCQRIGFSALYLLCTRSKFKGTI